MDWDISGSTAGISKVWDRHHVRARRSLAISCFMLGLALFVLAGCDSESLFGGSSSETEKALGMFDASFLVVAHIDLDRGFESLEDVLRESQHNLDDLDRAMEEVSTYLGINPRNDIHDVYVALSGIDSMAIGSLIAFVDFNQDEMITRLESVSELRKVETAGKTDSYRFEDRENMQFSLIDGTMIVVSNNDDQLNKMISRSNDSVPSSSNDAMLQLLDKRESWVMVRNVDVLLADMDDVEGNTELAELLPTIKAITSVGAGLNTSSGDFEGVVYIEPRPDVTAKDFASLISGFRAAARLAIEDGSEISDLLEEFDISTEKDLVRISLDIGEDSLSDIMKSAGAALKEMAGNRLHKEDSK
jgi:hypothetical protein